MMNALTNLLAVPFSYILEGLFKLTGYYSLSIIILSILVRLALYPIAKKQVLSSVNMAKMQPKINAIRKKYSNDRAMLNQKMAELYKEENFNPAQGCLPAIVNLIVIIGLFSLFRNPLSYINNDQMYFAIHQSFLWIKDLAQPDLWILPILSGIATFFSYSLSPQSQMQNQPGSEMMTVMMKYVFPIMIVWLARSYPSALAIYWFIGQVMQVFFNLHFRKLKKDMNTKKSVSA